MSHRSSPARSTTSSVDERTMHSSRDASPLQLTPRSKIKAMLAAIDDESDAGDVPDNARSPTVRQQNLDESPSRSAHASGGTTTNSEDSSGEPVRARGKIAARLQSKVMSKIQPGNSPAATTDEDEEEQDAGNAYERVKRTMMLKASEVQNKDKEASPEQESADDEEDGPIVPRRRRMDRTIGDPDKPKSPLSTPVRSHRSSPGLFLTPGAESEARSPKTPGSNHDNSSPSKPVAGEDSDSDLPANPATNERFLALVARKRAERQAQEAAVAEKRAAREAQYEQKAKKGASRRSATPLGDSEDDSDDATARKLTQQARPTRKASKKALEEMNRETQRMNRNMQLAHQARTKKKITKESLFARFNFRTASTPNTDIPQTLSSSTAVSSAHVSEAEGAQHQATPPTSPSAPQESPKLPTTELGDVEPSMETHVDQDPSEDEEMPTVQDIMNQPLSALQKGKGKAIRPKAKDAKVERGSSNIPERKSIKVHFPKPSVKSKNQKVDSDSDLEVVPARKNKASRLDVFNRLPQGKPSEARSLQTLRALAHLNSPGKVSGKSRASMTLSDMQMSLQQRARQQAAAERAEKIQDLKNRGIIVQTAEERQKDQVEVEDLVEKARQEAVDIKKKEKDAAKRAAKKSGEEFNDSSDDDEDYEGNEADESEIELSGSEEEGVEAGSEDELGEEDEEGDGEEAGDVAEGEEANGLVENEAMEDADDEEASEAAEEDEDAIDSDQDLDVIPQPRRMRVNRIVEEDEEEGPSKTQKTQHLSPALETPRKPNVPFVALGTSPGLMGMTQAFEATMADSQTQKDLAEIDQEEDSISFLGAVPEPNIPLFEANESESMIVDSQAEAPAQDTSIDNINLDFTQSQIDYETTRDTQEPPMATQDFEIPEPTQDVGFHLSSPAGNRFVSAPPSTVDTVLLPESPIKKKKGRLQRRRGSSVAPSEVVPSSLPHAENFHITADAFDVMKKKRNAAATIAAFDKKKSNAKEMVEEQAQESEDEYAGLGGASDDESGGEEDEDLKKMIEHGDVEVDERKLAAFYADKERASDEQAISKLYKDINNGGLRRKRGADFDLSDSDDDAEARRRIKRAEFARMRKALLADEKLGKIAEDPKKMAFLKAVEDREEDEDLGVGWDILETPQEQDQADSTQEIADSQTQPPDAAKVNLKRKRPLQESLPNAANRPPPAARRTKTKRPATLAEIRESVSFLIETPESMSFQSFHAPDSSDIEDENAETENQNHDTDTLPTDLEDPNINDTNSKHENPNKDSMPPPPLPHRNPRRTSAPIIDRLSLKRASSASTANTSSRLAFAAPSSTTSSTFTVPSLLRRASTSALSLALTQNTDKNGISTLAATEQAAGGDGKGGGGGYVKRGGRKGSSILGQAREMERRAVVEGVERRRREERERIAGVRREGFLGVGSGNGGWEI